MPRNPEWQPTSIERFERCLDTSVQTMLVETDQGKGYLKAMGNPEGPHALACELVATQLADWLGLPTLEFAIVQVTVDDVLPFHRGGNANPGPAYITRAMQGTFWDGSEKKLNRLENPGDLSRLMILDTWTLNRDRHDSPNQLPRRKPNLDNVFLSDEAVPGKLRLVAIDHTHCFTCGRELTGRIADVASVQDTGVYGLFPEFRKRLDWDILREAAERLRELPRDWVQEVVAGIPREWDVSPQARAALVSFIVQRAAFLSAGDKLIRLIEPQRDLDLPE